MGTRADTGPFDCLLMVPGPCCNSVLSWLLTQPWGHSWSNRFQPGTSVSHWCVYKDLGVTDLIPVCLAFLHLV